MKKILVELETFIKENFSSSDIFVRIKVENEFIVINYFSKKEDGQIKIPISNESVEVILVKCFCSQKEAFALC